MEKRVHYYVSRKNVLTWLMALCLVCSAVARIVIAGMKGTGGTLEVWSQIVLPIAASLLYVLIALCNGEELFYKTAIPVWMLAAFFGLSITQNYDFGKMVNCLFWVSLVFFAVIYGEIAAGKIHYSILLFPLFCCPLATIGYLNRDVLLSRDLAQFAVVLPDFLLLLGLLLLPFAMRVHPHGEYHPTWGDRCDGRRLRTLDPQSYVSPYIMVNRSGASNLFAESFEISHIDHYIRQKRRQGLTNFGMMHVFLAAYCRGLCRYPALNRFLSGQHVYSRGNDVQFCLTVKKEMSAASPDTTIKLHLTPQDTADDVYRKMNEVIETVKNSPLDSSFDKTAHALTLIPGVILKFVVWMLKTMDYFGLLPKFLLEVSPFHGSLFFTSMGSLGIPPIYHHLYDFGNLPVFGAFGCKRRAVEVLEDGTVVTRKYVDFKFTLDERIVDGYYYAAFFKHFKRILSHPEILDHPPEEVLPDID